MIGSPMLMLLFRVGEALWAIATSEICEVVPLVALQAMSQGWADEDLSGETAGLMNYHGKTIPVVDVSVLLSGQAAKQTLSTRIVVVEASDSLEQLLGGLPNGSAADRQFSSKENSPMRRRLGLILADASETARLEPVANIPVASRYVQSIWQLTADSEVVRQLAVDPVMLRVYQETAEIVPVFDDVQMDLLETVAANEFSRVSAE